MIGLTPFSELRGEGQRQRRINVDLEIILWTRTNPKSNDDSRLEVFWLFVFDYYELYLSELVSLVFVVSFHLVVVELL